jgi:TatD DNase family protein
LEHARGQGVTRVVTIGTGLESSARAVALAHAHEGVFAVVGIHPSHAHEASPEFPDALRMLAADKRVVAIGETGLDFHRLPGTGDQGPLPVLSALGAGTSMGDHVAVLQGAVKAAQEEVFRAHLELAVELGLNVVIHQRDAWVDTLRVLRDYDGRVRGVFHCFGGTAEQALEVISLGHSVSFTGIVTFKNAAQVRATAAAVPPGSYMVETDCPYLAPTPHRGGRCEPAHTRLVAEAIARERGISVEEVGAETEKTAEGFFAFVR